MTTALGIFGLAVVLFAVLLLGPYVKRLTEGFADGVTTEQVQEVKQEAKKAEEKIKDLMKQIDTLNTLMEDPTVSSSTKEKIVKEKEDLQKQIQDISGQPLPSAEVQPVKEGFEPSPSSGAEYMKNAASVSF